jgi:hypothetical protein
MASRFAEAFGLTETSIALERVDAAAAAA